MNYGVVGGLVVEVLDCGVRGHIFKSHQLLPREGFSPGFSPLPTGKDLIQATLCFLSNPAPRVENKRQEK